MKSVSVMKKAAWPASETQSGPVTRSGSRRTPEVAQHDVGTQDWPT